jgi:AcrR family transcriptional regulator
MTLFGEKGFEGARMEELARSQGIAKGSIFQYFGSKQGLFLAAYKRAVSSFHAYLDAPEGVKREGFFATLRYWLDRTDALVREDWIPYRVSLLGNYGTDLQLRRDINRFLRTEDPYGTAAFVAFGLERRELRRDIDRAMIVSLLDWTVERFQDAILTEEMDPGLFRNRGLAAERETRIDQFMALLRGAIGVAPTAEPRAPRRRTGSRARRGR